MNASAAAIMQGRFYECDLPSLLEILSVGRQHVAIDVRSDEGLELGVIVLKSGRLLRAKAGQAADKEALRRLFAVPKEARFMVVPQPEAALKGVPFASVAEVVAELAQMLNDNERVWVMSGSLGELDLMSLMQVVSLGRELTGIEILDGRGALCGCIFIKSPRVLKVTCDQLLGMDAFRRLLHLDPSHGFRVYRARFDDTMGDGVGLLNDLLLAIGEEEDDTIMDAERKRNTVRPAVGAPPPAAAVPPPAPVPAPVPAPATVAKPAFAKGPPSVQRAKVASPKLDPKKQEKVTSVLKDMCEASHGVVDAVVISREGLLVSAKRTDASNEAAGAHSAVIWEPALRVAKDLLSAQLEHVWIRSSAGSVLLHVIDEHSAVAVVTNETAPVGLVLLELRRAVRSLGALLS